MVLGGLLFAQQGAAGAETGWSLPRKIFQSPGQISTQAITVDTHGRVHAFWLAEDYGGVGQSSSSLYYLRLDALTERAPVDILGETGSIGGVTATTDGSDHVLVNVSGNRTLRAPAGQAGSVRAWSECGEGVAALFYGHVTVDLSGTAWVAYSGRDDFNIYVQKWQEAGWNDPIAISPPVFPNAAPDYARVAFDSKGTIHVVWSEYQLPAGWPPLGTLYSRSADGGASWSRPVEIAIGPYHQPALAVGPNDDLHVLMNGMVGIGGRYYRRSSDGGQTWTRVSAIVPPGKGGSEHTPNLVVDAAGVAHVLTSYDNAAWYLALYNGNWSAPECVSCAPGVPRGHLEAPSMALGVGNLLHVLFWVDDTQLFYTTRTIGAPARAPLPLPTPAPTAIRLAPTAIAALAPTRPPVAINPVAPGEVSGVPAAQIVASILAPLLAVCAFGLVFLVRRRQ
ncbi:MAG: hypothetical protein ABIQ99_19325 [Thermoflexales bacterium]